MGENGQYERALLAGGVKYISPIAPLWLPEPYSLEARQRDKGRVQNRDEVVRYQTLAIKLDDERFNRNIVWKDLVFMPALPRLENGKLIGPVGRRGGNYDLNVFTTLDNEPPDVKRDSCGMRLIEGQWFVRMCRINY